MLILSCLCTNKVSQKCPRARPNPHQSRDDFRPRPRVGAPKLLSQRRRRQVLSQVNNALLGSLFCSTKMKTATHSAPLSQTENRRQSRCSRKRCHMDDLSQMRLVHIEVWGVLRQTRKSCPGPLAVTGLNSLLLVCMKNQRRNQGSKFCATSMVTSEELPTHKSCDSGG